MIALTFSFTIWSLYCFRKVPGSSFSEPNSLAFFLGVVLRGSFVVFRKLFFRLALSFLGEPSVEVSQTIASYDTLTADI